MQTMTTLIRIGGNRNMTVPVLDITPAEALVLAHIHDPDTKDIFEDARLAGEVESTKLEERERLVAKYPKYAKLVNELFPGRNATDVPETFAELQDIPLEVAAKASKRKPAPEPEPEAENADPANLFGASTQNPPLGITEADLPEPVVKGRKK